MGQHYPVSPFRINIILIYTFALMMVVIVAFIDRRAGGE